MGCTSSNTTQQNELENLVKKQTVEIEKLHHTNQELRAILENILAENEKLKAQDTTGTVQRKIGELEIKIQDLETKLVSQSPRSDDTFHRDSDQDPPPAILLESNRFEVPQSDGRSSHSIMEDPFIKERYERKRQMFVLKKNRQAAGEQDSQGVISPTMTSTYMSNK